MDLQHPQAAPELVPQVHPALQWRLWTAGCVPV
jgi:hypothetical protein